MKKKYSLRIKKENGEEILEATMFKARIYLKQNDKLICVRNVYNAGGSFYIRKRLDYMMIKINMEKYKLERC